MARFSFDPRKRGSKSSNSERRTDVQRPGPTTRQDHATRAIARAHVDAPPALPRDGRFEPQRPIETKRKTEQQLTQEDWNTVLSAFKKTGNAAHIAKNTGLPRQLVQFMIQEGIPRLGLPAIHDYAIDRSEVNLDLHRSKKERQAKAAREDVQEAVTERAISETASAQQMLEQATRTGALLDKYTAQLTKQLLSGTTELDVPEVLTPAILETLAKVADANSRTMERAVKLVRLTAGEATELVEHKIAHLIAGCTTEELAQAATTGQLPKRLTSRAGGSADPMDAEGNKVAGGKHAVIDVDFTPGKEPTWKKSVTYEGRNRDSEAVEVDDE